MAALPADSSWYLDVSTLWKEWTTTEPETKLPIFEHELKVLGSKQEAEIIAKGLPSFLGLTTKLDTAASSTWPWALESPMKRLLFTNPVYSAVCAQAALQGRGFKMGVEGYSEEFLLEMQQVDYMLALVEIDSPSG